MLAKARLELGDLRAKRREHGHTRLRGGAEGIRHRRRRLGLLGAQTPESRPPGAPRFAGALRGEAPRRSGPRERPRAL